MSLKFQGAFVCLCRRLASYGALSRPRGAHARRGAWRGMDHSRCKQEPLLRWPTALKNGKNWKFEFLPQTYLKLFLTTPSLSSEIKMKIILFVLELGPFLFAHSFKESHCRSCEISLYLLCSHFCPREPKTVEVWSCFLRLQKLSTPTLIAHLKCCHGSCEAQCAYKRSKWRKEEEAVRRGLSPGRRSANIMASCALLQGMTLLSMRI